MPLIVPSLPPGHGYRSRAAEIRDVPAIHALVAACERAAYGRVQSDAGAVAAVFTRPRIAPETDTVLVLGPDGRPAAWAWVDRRSEVDVHPAHRGRGLGAALLDWVGARARQTGTERLAQTVPDTDAGAVALVRSRGYRPMVTSWLLESAMPDEPEVPEPPPGVTVRPYRHGDARAVHVLVQDAFDEWQERRQGYEEWAAHTVARHAFAPDRSALAVAGEQLVGAVLVMDVADRGEGYVEQVAVHRDARRQGIARLLLRHAFRASYRAGQRTCTLWTHSNTGALGLYLRVGMTVRQSATVFLLPLPSSGRAPKRRDGGPHPRS